jgi:DNA-binding XRE family transcriptional regulator
MSDTFPLDRLSGRQLAAFLGVSPQTISRWERDGLIERGRNGKFALQSSVQGVLQYVLVRHQWAFHMLRVHGIFDESRGDVFESGAL